jgi:hypothetical protein
MLHGTEGLIAHDGTLEPPTPTNRCRSGAISGGLTPFAAPAFMAWTDRATWPISIYLIVLAVITFIATMAAPETAGNALN